MDLSQPASNLIELVSLVIRGVSENRDLSLTAVATLGSLDRRGPQRITTMAAAEGVSQPSMTQLVQRLEQRGLVTRRSDPSDGRVALVSLTDAGRAALADRRQRNAERVADLLADLPDDGRAGTGDALAVVLPAMRDRVGGDARVASGTTGCSHPSPSAGSPSGEGGGRSEPVRVDQPWLRRHMQVELLDPPA